MHVVGGMGTGRWPTCMWKCSNSDNQSCLVWLVATMFPVCISRQHYHCDAGAPLPLARPEKQMSATMWHGFFICVHQLTCVAGACEITSWAGVESSWNCLHVRNGLLALDLFAVGTVPDLVRHQLSH